MKDIFLETFDEDMQKICNEKNKKCENSYNKTREQNLRIHDEFWNSLDDEQKNKYRDFENILYSENLETEEEIYIFALKKGIAIVLKLVKVFTTNNNYVFLKTKDKKQGRFPCFCFLFV